MNMMQLYYQRDDMAAAMEGSLYIVLEGSPGPLTRPHSEGAGDWDIPWTRSERQQWVANLTPDRLSWNVKLDFETPERRPENIGGG